MTLTHDQLEALKAANYERSRVWEAATFLLGDRVLSHGWTVTRTADRWTCNTTGTEYTTLSRWIRHKLGRRSYNVRSGAYLIHGERSYPLFLIPPAAERNLYQPWNIASTRPVNEWFLAQRRQQTTPATAEPVGEVAGPATAEPTGEVAAPTLAMPPTLEQRVAALEERLLAVAALAAHTALFKERIEALEALSKA